MEIFEKLFHFIPWPCLGTMRLQSHIGVHRWDSGMSEYILNIRILHLWWKELLKLSSRVHVDDVLKPVAMDILWLILKFWARWVGLIESSLG